METIQSVREKLDEQNFDAVIESVNTIALDQLPLEERYLLQYYQTVAYINSNQIQDAVSRIEEILEEEGIQTDYANQSRFLYLQGTIDFLKGAFEKAEIQLKKAHQYLADLNPDEDLMDLQGDVLNRLATVYTSIGDYDASVKYSMESLAIREELGLTEKISANLYNLGSTYFQSGNLDKAAEFLTRTYEVYKEQDNMLGVAYCKMELGGVYQYQGKLKKALDNFISAHELYKEYGSDKQLAWSLTDLGNIYQRMGEIDRSLEFYKQAIPLYQKLEDPRVFGNHLRAMAISHRYKGDYDQAIKFNNKALQLYESIDNKNFMARALYQLSYDYLEQEIYQEAEKYLLKSQELFEAEQNLDYLGRIYYTKSQLMIAKNNFEEATINLEKLSEVRGQSSSELLDHMYRVGKATIEVKSDRIVSIAKGIERLNQVIREEVKDIQITTTAYLLLLESLLTELEFNSSQAVIQELDELIGELDELADRQSSPSLKIKSMIISSKLALLTANLDSCDQLLEEANKLAEEKGYSAFVITIVELQKELQEQREHLEQLFSQTQDVDIILESTGLKQFIGNLLSNSMSNLHKRMDRPIHINLISQFGTSFYSKNYQPIDLEDQLIAGFISALSNFSQETFKGEKFLDSIKIGSYHFSIRNLDNYTICYLYEGSNISANHKLDKLSDDLQSNYTTLIDQVTSNNEILSDLDIEPVLDKYLN